MTPYTPATTGQLLEARERYALEKYRSLPEQDRTNIEAHIDRLHRHFKERGFKPEPSERFKLDLLLCIGTFINQTERDK